MLVDTKNYKIIHVIVLSSSPLLCEIICLKFFGIHDPSEIKFGIQNPHWDILRNHFFYRISPPNLWVNHWLQKKTGESSDVTHSKRDFLSTKWPRIPGQDILESDHIQDSPLMICNSFLTYPSSHNHGSVKHGVSPIFNSI